MCSPADVLEYWFEGAEARDATALGRKLKRWFAGGPAMDVEIAARFGSVVERALGGGYTDWEEQASSRLALILVLDQFPRSIYRNLARAYAGDARAQGLALRTLDAGEERGLWAEQRLFILMPLLHAEDMGLQERCTAEALRLEREVPAELTTLFGMTVEQANKYRGIIRRFGRFPHRNEILGRTAAQDELTFMKEWAEQAAPSGMKELRSEDNDAARRGG